jgi:hypothetical protein
MMKNKLRNTKLRNTLAGFLSGLALSLGAVGEAKAETPPFNASAVVSGYDKFLGKDGPVLMRNPVLQSNVNGEIIVSKSNLIVPNIWSNYDLKNNELSELDVSLGWKRILPYGMNISAGATFLYFPNGFANHSAEVYMRIGHENNLANLSATGFYDFVDGKGFLGLLRGDHPIYLLGGRLRLVPSATLGYNNGYFQEINGLSHLVCSLEAAVKLNDNFSLFGTGSYQVSLDNRYKTLPFFGIGLSGRL